LNCKFVEPKIGSYPAHPLIKTNKINEKISQKEKEIMKI